MLDNEGLFVKKNEVILVLLSSKEYLLLLRDRTREIWDHLSQNVGLMMFWVLLYGSKPSHSPHKGCYIFSPPLLLGCYSYISLPVSLSLSIYNVLSIYYVYIIYRCIYYIYLYILCLYTNIHLCIIFNVYNTDNIYKYIIFSYSFVIICNVPFSVFLVISWFVWSLFSNKFFKKFSCEQYFLSSCIFNIVCSLYSWRKA